MMEITPIKAEDTWPIRHRAMWPGKSPEHVQLKEDAAGEHYGVWVGHRLVSVISLFNVDGVVQFRKFATLPEAQGQGHGSMLLTHVIEMLRARGARRLWCNARVEKTAFYEKAGMVKTDIRFVRDEQAYVRMEMGLAGTGG